MMTDEELLRAYREGRSEAAFAELVGRHVDLVYSTALRTVGEPQLAQDVAQAVFVHLARKAGSIRQASALPGWLYRVARDQAANAVRAERRWRQRERQAVKMNSTPSEETPAWGEIAPLLEEAMRSLARRDQDAVVLRFFRGQSLRQVGQALELSEDAAQKRLSRALERLRDYFARRGVKVSATVLASGLAAHAVQAAPAGAGAAISTAVITSGAAGAGTCSFANLLTKTILMTTTQKLSVAAVLTLAMGTGVFQIHRAGQVRARLQEVETQVQPLAEEANQLRQERDQAAVALKAAQYQLQDNSAELLRLRGEVTRLRADTQELARGKAPVAVNPPPSPAAVATPPSEPAPADLAARVSLLQQNLQQRPERQIPELQFAEEKDWLEAAKLVNTQSDIDVRKGLSLLRTLARFKVGQLLSPALLKYTEANNGDLPTDPLQLKSFLTVPMDDAALQRYEIIATGNTSTPGFDPSKPVLRERKDARVDPIYDASLMVSLNGIGGGGGQNTIFPSRGSSATSGIVTTKVVENTMYEGPAQPAAKSEGKSAPRP